MVLYYLSSSVSAKEKELSISIMQHLVMKDLCRDVDMTELLFHLLKIRNEKKPTARGTEVFDDMMTNKISQPFCLHSSSPINLRTNGIDCPRISSESTRWLCDTDQEFVFSYTGNYVAQSTRGALRMHMLTTEVLRLISYLVFLSVVMRRVEWFYVFLGQFCTMSDNRANDLSTDLHLCV